MNMHNLNIYVYVYVRRSPQLEGGIKREEEEAEEEPAAAATVVALEAELCRSRPIESFDTVSLRGVNVQRLFGSQRAMKSVEDFTEFEQRAAYFDGDPVIATRKGVNILERGSQVSVDALLMGIANVSANDACVVLGEGVAGSADGWVAMMKLPTDTIRRRNQPNGPAIGAPPVASKICCASIVPRDVANRQRPSDWRITSVTSACS